MSTSGGSRLRHQNSIYVCRARSCEDWLGFLAHIAHAFRHVGLAPCFLPALKPSAISAANKIEAPAIYPRLS
jgi:hypothetical protein